MRDIIKVRDEVLLTADNKLLKNRKCSLEKKHSKTKQSYTHTHTEDNQRSRSRCVLHLSHRHPNSSVDNVILAINAVSSDVYSRSDTPVSFETVF